MENNFWLSNPNQLTDKRYIFNLVPKESMNKNEKLNSLVRLSFVCSIIFSIITNDSNYFIIFFITLLITILIWNQNKEKYQEQVKEEETKQALEKEFDIENSKFLEGIGDNKTTTSPEAANTTVKPAGFSIDQDSEKPSTTSSFVPDNTKKIEGCSDPTKNNPMINLLPSNYYNQKFACPYTVEFEEKQKEFLNAPIGPQNNEIKGDKNYIRQFYTVPMLSDKRTYFSPLPIKEDRSRCVDSDQNNLSVRYACSF